MKTPESTENANYINKDDGLLYCGKCHTPMQRRLDQPIFGSNTIVPTTCQCRSKMANDRRVSDELDRHIQAVERLRSRGICNKAILHWNFANDNGSTPNLDVAKRYVAQFPKIQAENIGLLLWGDVGTGKSYFAGCIANALIDQEIPVTMTNFAKILGDMMNLQTDKGQYIRDLTRDALLIIDDFGMERDTAFALEQIYNVIDSRYTSGKPLVVTTNLTLAELRDTTQPTAHRRIYDRILQMCVPIQFKGESKRKDFAQEKLNKLRQILD